MQNKGSPHSYLKISWTRPTEGKHGATIRQQIVSIASITTWLPNDLGKGSARQFPHVVFVCENLITLK